MQVTFLFLTSVNYIAWDNVLHKMATFCHIPTLSWLETLKSMNSCATDCQPVEGGVSFGLEWSMLLVCCHSLCEWCEINVCGCSGVRPFYQPPTPALTLFLSSLSLQCSGSTTKRVFCSLNYSSTHILVSPTRLLLEKQRTIAQQIRTRMHVSLSCVSCSIGDTDRVGMETVMAGRCWLNIKTFVQYF